MKKVSLQDIARELKVSKSLVSFVLNGKGDDRGIHPDTQKRVLAKARELNYKPHLIARGLRLGRSHTLGLIVADISNNFYARIARRVEEVAANHGYHLIYCNSDEDPDKEISLIEMLRDRQVDGLIVSTTQRKSAFFTDLKKEQFPFVLIDRQLPMLKTNYVGVENQKGAYQATHHLLENNYRNIALLKISPGYLSTVKERERGYRDAMKRAGFRINHEWVREIDYHQIHLQVSRVLDELLGSDQPPDAIFSVNNNITVECMDYMNMHKVRIPEELALVSFDDIDLFRFSYPNITAIAQPLDSIGEEAVKVLLNEIEGNVVPGTQMRTLPVEFIIRESSTRMPESKKAKMMGLPEPMEHEN